MKRDVNELLAQEKISYEEAREEYESSTPANDVDLDMRSRIVDGDNILADTAGDGSFLATCARFEKCVQENFAAPA